MSRRLRTALVRVLVVTSIVGMAVPSAAKPKTPNILFVIMDDVGIDQMRVFGYGGPTYPPTPNIDTIAHAGVMFHNTWSMPACSTSRAVLFTGRYPLRTNVFDALGPSDLANSHVSPYEMTTPKLLAQRGYKSALFGKFHLGLQSNNPFGDAMPRSLGWDYFSGWLDETGDPSSIDTTAGGVDPCGPYTCGFVPGAKDHPQGADFGACYAANGTCTFMQGAGAVPPGRACRDAGGIFDPRRQCESPRPLRIDFDTYSGHYVSPLVIDEEDGTVVEVPTRDVRARTFRGTQVVDAAIDWIKKQPGGKPWMATVSFASAHTPLMQPPLSLLPPGTDPGNGLDCKNEDDQRVLMNQMVTALDTELGRLLVDTKIARRGKDGSLQYDPSKSDTMIVLVGDNGTLGYVVKQPFDPERAKGTAYQTGVWVPLVVAGPLVNRPDRSVDSMVNVADVYELFGEIAGIDVHAAVPRTLDSRPMMPYLTNPAQPSLRTSNFTQVGPNIQANGTLNGPCVFTSTCSQIPPTQSVCTDNGGTWWGPYPDGTSPPEPYMPQGGVPDCCSVNQVLAANDWPANENGGNPYAIEPLSAVAIRNDDYKIVRNFTHDYLKATNTCVDHTDIEFYAIDEEVPLPRLDRQHLQIPLPLLTPEQRSSFESLSIELDAILASQPACPGDGNIDGVVNDLDVTDWSDFRSLLGESSSWYDFNFDGKTNACDLRIIKDHLGTTCPSVLPPTGH